MPDNSILTFSIKDNSWEKSMYPVKWGEVLIQKISSFRARAFFTSQHQIFDIEYLYMKYVVNNEVETSWHRYISDHDLILSISPATDFDLLDQNGYGWLNTFNTTNHGNASPGKVRTGEGIFENIVYSSNIQLQRWTVNGYGIMFRQKTGTAWQAWKSIPYV